MPPAKQEIDYIPTPEVGQAIQWLRDPADPENVTAATCIGIEGPGQIAVAIQPNGPQSSQKRGVRYVGDQVWVERRTGDLTQGAWQYIPGQENSRERRFALHKALIAKQKRIRDDAERRRAEALARRANEQSELVTK